jgi:hypothetical protein
LTVNPLNGPQDAPFQSRRDGVIPFRFFTDFLDLLKRNSDLIQVITYADLDWGDDWDYKNNYPVELERWKAALKRGDRDPDKIYLFLQHDVDSHPERSINAVREEWARGIRSNVMVFNQRVDRQQLGKTGEVKFKDYKLDRDYLKKAEAAGFVIGYHCNALEQAAFDPGQAEARIIADVEDLSRDFDVRFYSPHGGVRGADGHSNSALDLPASLRRRLRWVHNRQTVRVDGNYSDGGLNGRARDIINRDPRDFIKQWTRGKRYRVLFHPQYFHTPYSESTRLMEAPWYRELLGHFGRESLPETVWPDSLLDDPRNKPVEEKRPTPASRIRSLARQVFRIPRFAKSVIPPSRPLGSPILIGGDGRSGTTLLSVILDSHPQLSIGSELHFNGRQLPNLGPYIEECFDRQGEIGRKAISDEYLKPGIQFINRCNRSGIPARALRETIAECRTTLGSDLSSFEDRCALVKRLGAYNARRKGASRWGFKIMREVRNLERYGAVWPDACFIQIIRDGRDVAASQMKEHGSWGYESIEKAAEGWVNVIEGARKSAEGLKYREIKYEDLVVRPEQTLRLLVAWLGEDWNPALLNHQNANHALFDSHVRHPSRDQVAKPVNSSAIGRFARDLDEDQLRRFESVAGGLLDEMGYSRFEDEVSRSP